MVREQRPAGADERVSPSSLARPDAHADRLARVVAKRCPDCDDLKLSHVEGPPLATDPALGALIAVVPCRICGCLRYLVGGGNVDVDEFPEWSLRASRRGL